ncbi:MAG: hypothetical protein IKU52_03480 [Clostridia bacterium]|nr:hypothetical protein [Clostridia bacterium]
MKDIIKDSDICLNNIFRLDKENKSVNTRIKAHIRELALFLSPLLPKELSEDSADQLRQTLRDKSSGLSGEQMNELCLMLSQLDSGYNFSQKYLDIREKKNTATAVYVKNALCDIAFEKFSKHFDKLSVYYADDFESALEDVYYSKADYTIIPVSSSKNGRLAHFGELILRYEMKICMKCTVHSNTDESETQFLLLSKNTESFGASESICFEFLLSRPEESFTDILWAAKQYGCKYISSHMSAENSHAVIELDVSKGNTDALCLYLFLEHPRHVPMGLYGII